jgi:hypothetical protein
MTQPQPSCRGYASATLRFHRDSCTSSALLESGLDWLFSRPVFSRIRACQISVFSRSLNCHCSRPLNGPALTQHPHVSLHSIRVSASFFASQRAKSDLVVHEVKPLTQLSETMLKMHGGRASISGVTATVFGASGFVSRYLCNRLGTMSGSPQASRRVCFVSFRFGRRRALLH